MNGSQLTRSDCTVQFGFKNHGFKDIIGQNFGFAFTFVVSKFVCLLLFSKNFRIKLACVLAKYKVDPSFYSVAYNIMRCIQISSRLLIISVNHDILSLKTLKFNYLKVIPIFQASRKNIILRILINSKEVSHNILINVHQYINVGFKHYKLNNLMIQESILMS